MKMSTMKNEWDNPYTGRVWHECGTCRRKVSKKAETCPYCGAAFLNIPKKKVRGKR